MSTATQTKELSYRKYIWLKWLTLVVMLGLMFVAVVLSLAAGSAALSIPEIVQALFLRGEEQARTIIWNVRMPRVATGIVVGLGLAMSGCIMQNVLRNSLASASTLGVSQGASFGAAVAIVFFEGGIQVGNTTANCAVTNPSLVSFCAVVFGMATTLIILFISKIKRSNPATMVLAGVPVDNLVFISMMLCALTTSISVAFAGTIGFIGLIGPHIMRRFVGNDYRFLIPCSALSGAILVLMADIASRSILPPTVLPIGALTSFLGAPLFLYLCLKGGKKK